MTTRTETVILDIQARQTDAVRKQKVLAVEIEKLQKQQKELNKSIREGNEIDEDLVAQKENVRKKLKELRTEQRKNDREMKLLTQAAEAQEGSFEQLSAKSGLLSSEYNKLSRAQRNTSDAGKQLKKNLDSVNAEMRELRQEVGDGRLNVGRYAESLGTLRGLQDTVSVGFKNIRAALIATGIGAAAVALGKLLGEGTKAIERIQEIRPEVARATGLAGDELDQATAKVTAIADTFDQDYQQSLIAAIALSERFGISQGEALELIASGLEGLTREQGGQLLDILQEYPELFDQMGVSAGEFVTIANQQITEGYFSDKGIDAIKEGALSIRELPNATREALEKVGLDVDDFQQRIQSGQITTFQGLQEIARATVEAGENSQEYGQILADVFRGAGEDAGDYVIQLAEIDTSYENFLDNQDEAARKQRELREANEDLQLAFNRLFGAASDGLMGLRTDFTQFIADSINGLLNGLQGISNSFVSAYNNSLPFRRSMQVLGGIAKSVLDLVRGPIVAISSAFDFFTKGADAAIERLKDFGGDVADNFDFSNDPIEAFNFSGSGGAGGEIRPPSITGGRSGSSSDEEDSNQAGNLAPLPNLPLVEELTAREVEIRLEQAQILADGLALSDEAITANKERQAALRKSIAESEAQAEQQKLSVIAETAGNLASLAREGSFANKLLASADTAINTYKAATQALAVPPGPPFTIPLAASVVGIGLANLAKINGVTFADGGFTGPSSLPPDQTGQRPVGVVHANEFVMSAKTLNTPWGMGIAKMVDSVQRGFASGGFTSPREGNPLQSESASQLLGINQAVSSAVEQQAPMFVSITDIRNANNIVDTTENVGKL